MTAQDKSSIPRLSIVIVGYNTREFLSGCVAGILDDPRHADYEIIVVDNDSRDGTVRMLREMYPNVTVIENRGNRGFAAACNQGMAISRAPFILLLNPDTRILPGNIGKALDYITTRPAAGIVGCRILYPDGSTQPSIRDFPGIWNCFVESFFLYGLFPRSRLFGRYHGTCFDYSREQEANVLLGAFLLLRKSLIDEIGLLDERFFVYAEETDLCRRSQSAGWKNLYTPGAEIIHYEAGSSRLTAAGSFILLHESLHKYAKKYFSPASARIFVALLFTGAVLRMVVWMGAALIRRNEYTAGRRSVYIGVVKWYLGIGSDRSTEKERK